MAISMAVVWYDFFLILLGITFEALPFVLMGVLVSAVLHVFVSTEYLLRWLPKSVVGRMCFASFLGFLFPVCECGNVPVAKRLMAKGLPPYVAIMFLLTAPVVNPIVIVATWAAFRSTPELVFFRVLLTLIIGAVVGWVFRFATFTEVAKFDVSPHQEHSHGPGSACHQNHSSLKEFVQVALHESAEMIGVLLIGASIAAAIQVLMPRVVLLSLAQDALSAIISMEILAFIISICSNVDAFFILGLSTTIGTPAILAFLVFGPMVDIKALFMLSRVFKSWVIISIVLATSLLTWALTLYLAYVF